MARLTPEQFTDIFPFFRNSPETLIRDILSSSRYGFTSRGTEMQSEGQLCTGLEVVLSGEKRVYEASPAGRQITLYEIGQGEACILNTVCVLPNMPSPMSAMAITDVCSFLIPAEDLPSLLSTDEDMRAFVLGTISRRFVTILKLISEIVFEKMDESLFDYLVEKSEDGMLSMTHQHIANDLGRAREVVSRLLENLERKGKVTLSRGHIRLIAPSPED